MTDDITRGLTALADEAQPAPIDSHTVVQLAAAHTRARRAVLGAAFASIVAIGALTVAIGSWQQPGATNPASSETTSSSPTSTVPPPTFTSGEETITPDPPKIRKSATPEENAERKPRLQAQMTAALDRILPDGWEHSAFGFGCDQTGCFAEGDVIDDTGTTLKFFVYVSDQMGDVTCYEGHCDRAEVLDDGTSVALTRDQGSASVTAERPDRTGISVSADWPDTNRESKLTDDQWLAFATAFTY